MWCPGCGHGIVLNSLLRAVEELGLNKNNIVMTSGIGCSARISGYVDFHSLHTLHGRALAFATGVKLSQPELTLLVPMGDGDAPLPSAATILFMQQDATSIYRYCHEQYSSEYRAEAWHAFSTIGCILPILTRRHGRTLHSL